MELHGYALPSGIAEEQHAGFVLQRCSLQSKPTSQQVTAGFILILQTLSSAHSGSFSVHSEQLLPRQMSFQSLLSECCCNGVKLASAPSLQLACETRVPVSCSRSWGSASEKISAIALICVIRWRMEGQGGRRSELRSQRPGDQADQPPILGGPQQRTQQPSSCASFYHGFYPINFPTSFYWFPINFPTTHNQKPVTTRIPYNSAAIVPPSARRVARPLWPWDSVPTQQLKL